MLRRNGKTIAMPLIAVAVVFLFIMGTASVFAAMDDHIVVGKNPQGTVVNLFDYWTTSQDAADFTPAFNSTGGINKDHYLKFSTGQGNGQGNDFNRWTGSASPCSGMVSKNLDNGFPKLVVNNSINSKNAQSLGYLFNEFDSTTSGDNKIEGKKAYTNVDGLMQVNDDGYYYYDSTKNFASYDSTTNSMKLYDTPGVKHGSTVGQFFPFNSATDVFDENKNNGSLSAKNIWANSDSVNHWFGVSMSTHFMQPTDGKTTTNKDITYEFSGDDDVWVYIDGVLVGDLGGIHDAASLKINFSTGAISINGKSDGTLKSKYDEAGKTSEITWKGNTFADNTYHTLKFFYLERGNYASNMSLKFNLKLMPDNEISKVDPYGKAVQGAEYALYEADRSEKDGSVEYKEKGKYLCSGSTDVNGSLILKADDGATINFEELYKKNIGPYYILKETKAPDGYRKTKDVWLQYDPKTGAVTTENQWDTGIHANPRIMITAPTDLYDRSGKKIQKGSDGKVSGSIFAVVYKKTGNSIDGDSNWSAVSGSVLDGWKLHTADSLENVLKGNKYELTLNSMGAYETTLSELPGDIMTYSNVIIADNKDKSQDEIKKALQDKVQYSISYFYTTGDVQDATKDNTTRLDTGILTKNPNAKQYDYQYAVKLTATDATNDLYVQKASTESGGFNDHCINGVKFALYPEDQTTLFSRTLGNDVKLKSDATPVQEQVTKEMTQPLSGRELHGMAVFPKLKNGIYYLKEIDVPDGYKLNETLVKVVVNDNGVFADAGTEDDGIYASRGGCGMLLKSMEQFAENNDIDTTLTNMKVRLRVSKNGPHEDGTWDDDSELRPEMDLQYYYDLEQGGTGRYKVRSDYEKADESDPGYVLTEIVDNMEAFSTDTGWPSVVLTQCKEHNTGGEKAEKTDLGEKNLSNLFVLDTIVTVHDEPVGDLEISKTVKNESSDTSYSNKEFEFTVNLTKYAGQEEDEEADEDGNKGYHDVYEPVKDTFRYTITHKDGTTTDNLALITNEAGNGTIHLKDGETAVIKDLPSGVRYEITEKAESYWTVSSKVTGDVDPVGPDGPTYQPTAKDKVVKGSIPKPDTDGNKLKQTAAYTNTYDPASASLTLPVEKLFDGWDKPTTKDASFTMRLTAIESAEGSGNINDTMPEGSVQEVDGRMSTTISVGKPSNSTKDQDGYLHSTSQFPALTFNHAGTYTYTIRESIGDEPDVRYSDGVFGVVVTVKDDENGNLTASYDMKRQIDDDGTVIPTDNRKSWSAATFKNTYSEQFGYIDLRAHKTYENATGSDALTQDQFRFTLTAVGNNADNAPMPGGTSDRAVTVGNTTEGSISFPTFEFSTQNIDQTYIYQLKEAMPADANEGNEYTVNGTAYDDDVYYIKIKVERDSDNSPKPVMTYYLDQNCTEQITSSDARKEDHLYESAPGVYRLWFNNSYTAAPVTVAIQGSKTLNGRDMAANEFGFTLEGANAATQKALTDGSISAAEGTLSANAPAATDGDAGTFTFPEMTFTKTGTYTFLVKENIPENAQNNKLNGVTYDTNVSTVTVVVSDKDDNGNKTGTLTANVSYENSKHQSTDNTAEFVNTYVESGSAQIKGTKNLTGRDFKDGDSFTFTVTPKDGAPAPKDKDDKAISEVTITPDSRASAEIDFGTVNFDQDGQSYTYELKEKQPAGETKGITYDDTTYTLTLTAKANTPQNGTLTIEQTLKAGDQTANEIVWNNQYKPTGSLKLDATKTLTGRKWKNSDSFRFKLWAKADEKLPDALDKTKTPYTEEDGNVFFGTATATAPAADAEDQQTVNIDFETLHFTKAGTFEFYMEEIPANDMGMIYDSKPHRIPVEVTDDGEGHLTAKVADNSITNLNFNNVYNSSVEYSNEAGLVIQKTLNGRDMAAGQFEFTVEGQSSGSGETAVSANQAAAKLGFGQGETKKTFQSSAAADGTACSIDILDGQKVSFNQDDIGKTFCYKVTETKGGDTGYTNDTTEYRVEIALEDLGAGAMEATTTVTNVTLTPHQKFSETEVRSGDDQSDKQIAVIPFTNSYSASGSLNGQGSAKIEASKTLNGRAMKKDEFTFHVTNAKDTAEQKTIVSTGKNAAADAGKPGAVDFAEIKYTTAKLKQDVRNGLAVKEGNQYTYQYEVSEATENLPAGVSPVEAVFAVTVTVTDNGDGTLTAKATYPAGADKLNFVNEYDTTEVSIPIKGIKSLKLEGESAMTIEDIEGKYQFSLTGQETTAGSSAKQAPVPTLDGKEMLLATNGRTGEIDFGHITLQASDFDEITPDNQGNRTRTFEYKITEKGSVAGVVNDREATKTISATVKYNSKEKSFQVTGVPEGAAFQFTNIYGITSTEVDASTIFPVNKVLKGRDLKDGEFQFELMELADDEAVVIAKGTTKAASAGTASAIDFGKITYDAPGEHDYVIREVIPSGGRDANTVYDTRSYSIHVSVTDQKDGTLKVTSDVSADKPLTFTNKQTSKNPSGGGDSGGSGENGGSHTKTGDQTPIGMAILLLMISACVATLVLGLRRESAK